MKMMKKLIVSTLLFSILIEGCSTPQVITPNTKQPLEASVKTTPTQSTQEPTLNPPRKPLGVFKDVVGYLDSDIENEWRGIIDGKYLIVYAGVIRKEIDPDQSVLIVKHEVDKPDEIPNDAYMTSEKHGALRIIKENDSNLTLEARDGTTYLFNIITRTFTKLVK